MRNELFYDIVIHGLVSLTGVLFRKTTFNVIITIIVNKAKLPLIFKILVSKKKY